MTSREAEKARPGPFGLDSECSPGACATFWSGAPPLGEVLVTVFCF